MKQNRTKIKIATLLIASLLATSAIAANTPSGKGLTNNEIETGQTVVIFPSPAAMVKEAFDTFEFERENDTFDEFWLQNEADTCYEFSTAISEEQGSFLIGALMADMQVALLSGKQLEAIKAVEALQTGLSSVGGGKGFLLSLSSLRQTITRQDIDLGMVRRDILPVLTPFINSLISEQGNQNYFQLGSWTESMILAFSAKNDHGKLQSYFNSFKLADYFLDNLPASVPPGAQKALKKLAELQSKNELTPRDLSDVSKILSQLKDLLG